MNKQMYRIRWYDQFILFDAAQPSVVLVNLLSQCPEVGWVVLFINGPAGKSFYIFRNDEVVGRFNVPIPDMSAAEALNLQESLSSDVIFENEPLPQEAELPDAQYPSLHRKLRLSLEGNPLSIGEAQAPLVSAESKKGQTISYHNIFYSNNNLLINASSANIAEVPSKDYRIVRIFFATDRQLNQNAVQPALFFTGKRSQDEKLQLGYCDVSIPHDHRIGALESPHWWKFEFQQNPKKHIVLLQVKPEREELFYHGIEECITKSDQKQAFVFIHGFNVTFEEAARRTAQFAYDLGFKGVPILYSWPSEGAVPAYLADEETINWTKPHLHKFLSDLAQQSGATVIHLIAHSMGNRALVRVLNELSNQLKNAEPLFNQIVLTAPDIDCGEFMQLAGAIQRIAGRVTLYASSNDKAIKISKEIHKYPRAGEAGDDMVITSGIDTIDATNVDTSLMGHSYYCDQRTVLSDLYYVINDRKPPSERHGLIQANSPRGNYWLFKQ